MSPVVYEVNPVPPAATLPKGTVTQDGAAAPLLWSIKPAVPTGKNPVVLPPV